MRRPPRGRVARQELALGRAIALADRQRRHLAPQQQPPPELDEALRRRVLARELAVAWSHRSRRISALTPRNTISRRPWVAATAPEAYSSERTVVRSGPPPADGFVGLACELGDGVGLDPRSERAGLRVTGGPRTEDVDGRLDVGRGRHDMGVEETEVDPRLQLGLGRSEIRRDGGQEGGLVGQGRRYVGSLVFGPHHSPPLLHRAPARAASVLARCVVPAIDEAQVCRLSPSSGGRPGSNM